jgi:acetyl esterase/lipase
MSAALVFTVGSASVTAPSVAAEPIAASALPGSVTRISYGPAPAQFGDLYLPLSLAEPLPVVVMIHGGGWLAQPDLAYFAPLSASLAARGIAVWNIEYRRIGAGGDYYDVLGDVATAVDALGGIVQQVAGGRLNTNNVHLAGHSAGGQLAAWAASRSRLPAGAPGSSPKILARSVTTMAGVFDLPLALANGDQFLEGFVGGRPEQFPDRYALGSAINYLPLGVVVNAIHGDRDNVVGVEQSRIFVDAARRSGDAAYLTVLPGVGHGEFGNVFDPAWMTANEIITQTVF